MKFMYRAFRVGRNIYRYASNGLFNQNEVSVAQVKTTNLSNMKINPYKEFSGWLQNSNSHFPIGTNFSHRYHGAESIQGSIFLSNSSKFYDVPSYLGWVGRASLLLGSSSLIVSAEENDDDNSTIAHDTIIHDVSSNKLSVDANIVSPYEYALMSKLAYEDDLNILQSESSKYHQYLIGKGWSCTKNIDSNDYHAQIWVNDSEKQVVIAHRGSLNASSWITDIESVMQSKPGGFVEEAINTLSDDSVISCRNLGYRLSTTGHSLGGFLAQICVFWSKRPEFTESHFPDISAVVFDSPGSIDFLKGLRSNLESQRGVVDLSKLNIHNFCIYPTLVSTFGKPTGTIWHLSLNNNEADVEIPFIYGHKMENIILGFDPNTGQPNQGMRQMSDWPHANYSSFSNFSAVIENTVGTVVKAPFVCLNELYKKLVKNSTKKTWFEQIFCEEGQVQSFLSEMNGRGLMPDIESLDSAINHEISQHYLSIVNDGLFSKMDLCHFDQQVQDFILGLDEAKNRYIGISGWHDSLLNVYGEDGRKFLEQISVKKYDNKTYVEFPAFNGTAFEFQHSLLKLLSSNGVYLPNEFLSKRRKELASKLGFLEKKLVQMEKNYQQTGKLSKELVQEKDEIYLKIQQAQVELEKLLNISTKQKPYGFISSENNAAEKIALSSDLKEVYEHLEGCYPHIKAAEDRTLVLLIGNTNSGKSTTGNYLLGCQMIEKETDEDEDGNSELVIDTVDDNPPFNIGHDMYSSTTLYPTPVNRESFPWTLTDCPGFRGKRDEIRDSMLEAISTEIVIRRSKKVGAVLVVISLGELEAIKGECLTDLMKTIYSIFNGNGLNKLPHCTKLIVTKGGGETPERMEKKVRRKICGLVKECDRKRRLAKINTSDGSPTKMDYDHIYEFF